jgi:hypothetical protein
MPRTLESGSKTARTISMPLSRASPSTSFFSRAAGPERALSALLVVKVCRAGWPGDPGTDRHREQEATPSLMDVERSKPALLFAARGGPLCGKCLKGMRTS